MRVLLVRHAHAGSKTRWSGDDRLRPLSARGRRDARRLGALLAAYRPDAVYTSPYLRCLQTVAPLLSRHPAPLEECEELVPETGDKAAELVYDLAAGPGDRLVVCTHGETITDVLRVVAARDGVVGDDPPNEKASVWVLDAAGGGFGAAWYVAPGSRPPPPARPDAAGG